LSALQPKRRRRLGDLTERCPFWAIATPFLESRTGPGVRRREPIVLDKKTIPYYSDHFDDRGLPVVKYDLKK
jgi:hypothetical protein